MAFLRMLALLLAFSALRSVADDQVVLNNGTTITGQINGVSGGQVSVSSKTPSGGTVKLPYYLTDIKTVNMAAPPEVAKAHTATPAVVITTLEPLVQKYSGLPTAWVVEAMAELGDAYDTQGQSDKAAAIYTQIGTLYPNSPFQNLATVGQAKQSLKAGKIDDAVAKVQPLVDAANKNLAPSPSDGRIFAGAFLVYGQALEAQKKPSQALEAYLTVTTMFYQNPALVDQAQKLVQNLRTANPGVGVD